MPHIYRAATRKTQAKTIRSDFDAVFAVANEPTLRPASPEPPPHGQRLSFQASSAPAVEHASRVHFDILVGDLAAAHDRVLAAGGVMVGHHVSPRPGPTGQPVPWRVYRDPAGHPFCLVVR